MANIRTFYAVHQVAIKDNAASPTHNIAAYSAKEHASGWYSAADKLNGANSTKPLLGVCI